MATIIIQGTKEENSKALNALKSQFLTVKKQSETNTVSGHLSVFDAFLDTTNERDYTDQEIDLGLKCHSNAVQDCSSCPFKKEENCAEILQTEGSLYIQRLFRLHRQNDDE